MKERPILFSGPMVRAILEGRKTQTRRVVTVPWHKGSRCAPYEPYYVDEDGVLMAQTEGGQWFPYVETHKYGASGDRLWVRETWRYAGSSWSGGKYKEVNIEYPADGARHKFKRGQNDNSGIPQQNIPEHAGNGREFPCCTDDEIMAYNDYLDRWWARHRPSIHMSRWACRLLLDVKDIRVERLHKITVGDARAEGVTAPLGKVVQGFREIWDPLNEKRGYGWDANPWVWVIKFAVSE